jgi:hypothetical protein
VAWVTGGTRGAALFCCTALLGCQPTFRVPVAELPRVARDYQATQRLVFADGSERYEVTPQQQPELRVHADTCVVSPTPSASAADTEAACEQPTPTALGDARVDAEFLRLPAGRSLRLSSIDSAELVLQGQPARKLDRLGNVSRRGRLLLGGQIGGSGYAEILVQLALTKYLHPELGLMAFGPEFYLNGSGGIVLERPFENGFAPYAALGGAFILTAGPTGPQPCDKPIEQCPNGSSSDRRIFGYARAGVAKYFPGRLDVRLALDAGIWAGTYSERSDGQPERSERFLWPMAAGSVLVALPGP